MTQRIKIPRLSTGEMIDMEYKDLGDILSEHSLSRGGFYTSIFKFDGKEIRNNFYYSGNEVIGEMRYKFDCGFLRTHDLDLENAVFL